MSLNELAAEIHGIAESKGFWGDVPCGDVDCPYPADRNRGEILMLIVSEAAEALEAWRDGKEGEGYTVTISKPGLPMLTHYIDGWHVSDETGFRPVTKDQLIEIGFDVKPEGLPSEMADILIRTLDACAAWGIDIEKAVREKIRYNATRPRLHGRIR